MLFIETLKNKKCCLSKVSVWSMSLHLLQRSDIAPPLYQASVIMKVEASFANSPGKAPRCVEVMIIKVSSTLTLCTTITSYISFNAKNEYNFDSMLHRIDMKANVVFYF